MAGNFSIRIGHFLFKHFFPLYNLTYPIFKRKQDKFEMEVIKKMVKPGDVVLDIGANIGFYTKIFSSLAGEKGHVYSFEPDHVNFNYLKKNTRHLKNVSLIPKAVAEKTGVLKIYTSKLLNVDHRSYPVDQYEGVIEVKAIAIDDFLAGKEKPNFIKMDIQGAEFSALIGMQETLKKSLDIKILSECWPYGLKLAKSSAEELFDLMWQVGFHIYVVTNNKLELANRDSLNKYSSYSEKDYENILMTKVLI